MKLAILFVLVMACVFVDAHQQRGSWGNIKGIFKRGNIKFTISGRELPDKDRLLGTTDAFVEVALTEKNGQTQLGSTMPVMNSAAPDWSRVFQFTLDSAKDQWINFIVWDKNNFLTDSMVGRGSINALEFADMGQEAKVILDKSGYLILRKTSTSYW